MVNESRRTLNDLVRHVDSYPEEAFLFLREGLNYAVEKVHGEETDAHRRLNQYMLSRNWDVTDLVAHFGDNKLSKAVLQLIQEAGGIEKVNRHISGRDLCWGLRDYALCRWGLLARTVLESWNLRTTFDFGKIVFGFIDFDMMRKQPGDALDDFKNVYSFTEAFDTALNQTREKSGGGSLDN